MCSLLFQGSLGFVLSVTVQIIKIKPYIKVTYIPTYSPEELLKKMKEYSESEDGKGGPDFVEATIYTKTKAVIQHGEFVDKPVDGKINGINYFWKPFYYKHVETFLETPRHLKVSRSA